MRVRSAVPNDVLAITALHVSVSQKTYSDIFPEHYLTHIMPEEKAHLWQQRIAGGVDTERLCLTVAVEKKTLAGFACFLLNEETEFGTYLHNLYVAPNFRGQGVARNLLAKSIQRFSNERQSQPVHLLTLADNQSARSFYTSLGGNVLEERNNIVARYPEIKFVRYQWTSARELRKATLPQK